jgi:hypothetical protein
MRVRPRDINDRVGFATDWMGGEFADQTALDEDVMILMQVRSGAIKDSRVLEQDPGHRVLRSLITCRRGEIDAAVVIASRMRW